MRRTAIYMRVSTVMQATEGDSLPAQREALLGYIHAHSDMVLVGEYMDDGISGQKYEERDELQRMLADVEAGKIDLILCTKMDRLHRSLKNFLAMQEMLDKHGVKWLAIWEPMYDTSSPAGQLIINQMMSFAQFEAQNTGARIRQVMDYKLGQGQVAGGMPPCGYSVRDKRLVPNEDAKAVRMVFDTFNRTGSLAETMRVCSIYQCLPTRRASLKNLLQNKKYIGEHRRNKNYCEPIIDRELFDEVQRKIVMNVKCNQKHVYLFSGILFCAECGSKMDASACRKQNSKPDYRYKCRMHRLPVSKCDNGTSVMEKTIEGYLLSCIKPELEKYIFECRASSKPAEDNQKKIDALNRKIARLKELYINELISIEEYKEDKERYTNELAKLAEAKTPEPIDTTKLEELLESDIAGYYDTLSQEDKRFFWRSIIKRIVFNRDKHIVIEFL